MAGSPTNAESGFGDEARALVAEHEALTAELARLPLANEHRQRRLQLNQRLLAISASLAELRRSGELAQAQARVDALMHELTPSTPREELRSLKRQLAEAQAEVARLGRSS